MTQARLLMLAAWLLAMASAAPADQARRARPAGVKPVAATPFQCLPEDGGASFDVSADVRATGPGEARIAFRYRGPGDCDYLRVANASLALVRVSNGKPRGLGAPCALRPPLGGEAASLVIKRRPERISVIFRGGLILSVGDLAPPPGRVGCAAPGKVHVDAPRVQPVEPPAYSDDFMRRPDEPDDWEKVSGRWSVAEVLHPDKSANGFSYHGSGPRALAVTGQRFWDDYAVECSFQAMGDRGAAGLCLYYQDPGNYLALVWGRAEGLRLLRVRDGSAVALGERAVAWAPGQWYRLSLQARDGDLAAAVDGSVCLEARDTSFGHGQAGLLVESGQFAYDDFAVGPASYLHLTRPAASPSRWLASAGALVIGSTSWSDYEYRVRVAPGRGDATGILFGWVDPRHYGLVRCSASRTQILSADGGAPKVVAEAAAGCPVGQPSTVAIDFRPGYAGVHLNGRRIVESAAVASRRGAVGLSQPAAGVEEIVVCRQGAPAAEDEAVNAEFAQAGAHPDMAEWASAATVWVPQVSPDGACVFWHKGEFFGDAVIRVPLPPAKQPYRVSFSLAADGEDPRSGYTLTAARDGGKVSLQLLRRGQAVANGEAGLAPEESAALGFALMGACLAADLGERRVLAFTDVAPIRGRRVAFQASGAILDVQRTQVVARNTRDTTFRDAPVDWQVQSGTWEVTNRWSCDPRWSFFGGRGSRLAMAWHKERFSGDLVMDYFTAPRMQSASDTVEAFRDLNATICSDGTGPHSGYTLLVGGWHNRKAALLRNGRVVAENADFQLPPKEQGHRQWFDVRVEKRGGQIALAVDGRLLLRYSDPQPLSGDRVGMWTQDNGMMLARVLLSCEHVGERVSCVRPVEAPPAPRAAPKPLLLPLANDFEGSTGEWQGSGTLLALDESTAAQGKRSLRLTDAEAGGDFPATAVSGPFDAGPSCRVAFDYRIPPTVHVDLYARIGARLYAVGLTGSGAESSATAIATPLGRFEGVLADGSWHHASFDLGAALRRVLPAGEPIRVSEILFAALAPGDEYVAAGVTGNANGCSYHLDNFTITP